jgi:hypothetical protein
MRMQWLTLVLVGLALAPQAARAQIKLPIYEEDTATLKKVVFEEASARGDFQHGRMLRVTLNGADEKTIKGTLVRIDKQKGRIYLRTEPGAAPRAFAEKDIKRIDKGVIREVGYKQDVTQAEIQPLEIINGNKRTVAYVAPTLSPGERDQLFRLEAAQNELARLEALSERELRVLDTDIAIQAQYQKTQELLNLLLWKYNAVGALPGSSAPWSNQLFASLPSAIRQGPTVFPTLPLATDTLTKARQNLLVAQSHAIFERGTLVAVVTDDNEK